MTIYSIVSFPNKNEFFLHSFLYVHQRVATIRFILLCHWASQEPKLEVPTICKAYF